VDDLVWHSVLYPWIKAKPLHFSYATSILFENECPSFVHCFKQSALIVEEFEIFPAQLLWRCLICYESSLILLKCSSAVHIPMIFCILEITVISLNNQITPKMSKFTLIRVLFMKMSFSIFTYNVCFFFKNINISENQYSFFIIWGKISPILFIIRISSSFVIIHVFRWTHPMIMHRLYSWS